MKLDVIFKVQSALDNRATPHDIFGLLDTTYYSKSKDKEIRLGDMDITHFVRVYNNKDVDLFDKIHNVKKQLADIENQL
mgnify:FL=1|jgi:hypothetical protein|tara:strand:- start:177 stop:413 length:237 start_codon:yes stop_codon:yes gene_type:complete